MPPKICMHIYNGYASFIYVCKRNSFSLLGGYFEVVFQFYPKKILLM